MKIRNLPILQSPEPGDTGSGGPADTSVDTTVDTAATDSQPGADANASADAGGGTQPNAQAPAGAAAADDKQGPTERLMQAMFGKKQETPEEKAERQRDEQGRFAKDAKAPPADKQGKPGEQQQGQKPGEKATDKPAEKPEHQIPDGLKPEAQQRFQHLVNTNKELTTKVTEWEPIVASAQHLQQTFHQNGVREEQFTQAMSVVGLMNRGDFAGALKVLDEQRVLISLAMGKPLPGADALARFPDLKEAVDSMQITEAHALELARNRTAQHQATTQRQNQERQQQEQQRAEAAVQQGQVAVDNFCKQMMRDDIDYSKVEPLLLQQIEGGLLEGIPPERWAQIVEKNYRLIKQTATTTRSTGTSANVLRPTGGESPRQAPRNLGEAMWGKSLQA